MADASQTTRVRLWLWMIRVVGVIVPRRLRADWRQEWEGELRHREMLLADWDRLDWRRKLDLLWRSTSAFWDALWLQPHRLEDEMFQDLRYGVRMLSKHPGALGASLLQGRELSERDNGQAPMAVVINEALAQRFWFNEDPLGKRVSIEAGEIGRPLSGEVVGVIKDIREFGPAAPPTDVIYGSYLQSPWIEMETRELVVRTATDPLQLAPAVRGEVRALDGEVPAYNVRALEEVIAGGTAQARFSLILLGLFAAIAFALAIAGLYAVVAYSVAQRTHEIGIRVALGAQAGDVMKLVVGQGMKLALLGAVLGLPAALVLAGLMKNLLFGVSATDPLTLAVIACLLMLVALPACYLPARQATKVDPLIALRHE